MEPLQGLGDVIEQAMKEIRKTVLDASRQTGAWESFKAFTAAVDWRVRLHAAHPPNPESQCEEVLVS